MLPHDATTGGRAGFFGKVSSHGDFVARRLPPSFQEPWDAWLQAGLQASRQALGPDWLATYLGSPIWRFALTPGLCGAGGWAGVLMPSVDRVGRHFPLTLAGAGAGPLDQLSRCGEWYGRLEVLALSTLCEGFSLDAFDAALHALEAPRLAAAAAPGLTVLALDPDQPMDDELAAPSARLLAGIAAAALDGHSLWWTDGSAKVAPCVLVCRGLPAPEAFAGLLDAKWQRGDVRK
ncbi:MAG: type VI secretion system-associated protein TagF [Telluria sp.]